MAVYRGSRYVKTPVVIHRGDTAVLEIRKRSTFDTTDATYYTVVQGDTIDGIAYTQYGNAQLWWAILDSNPKYQTELDIKPGDVLVIPPFDEVVKVSE